MMDQSPYSAPESKLVDKTGSSDRILGYKKMVIHHQDDGEDWPNRCCKCNLDTDYKKELKLYYINPWYYLTFLISPLIFIIVSMIVRKKFVISLPICDLHVKKRRRLIILQWLSLGLMLVLGGVGIVHEIDGLILIAGLLLLCLVIFAMASRLALITKYKNEQIWIRGAKKPFIDSLPEYNL